MLFLSCYNVVWRCVDVCSLTLLMEFEIKRRSSFWAKENRNPFEIAGSSEWLIVKLRANAKVQN